MSFIFSIFLFKVNPNTLKSMSQSQG